jgi:membrane fusion protein (multidrug efflux system)
LTILKEETNLETPPLLLHRAELPKRTFCFEALASRVAIAASVAVVLFAAAGCEKPAAPAPPPPGVVVVAAAQKDIPVYGEWVGSLDGYTNANITPQVSGYLIKQDYREGSFVHKGDVLFEIDPRPFQAVLDQAKGQLAQAHAQLELADINVKRDEPMAKLHAIPQSQLDTDTQTKATAEAAVQSAEANVEQAALNLGFTKVLSLIDGIAGIAQTQIGNLVGPTTVLTSVSQVNPIKAYFSISEQEYLAISDKIKGSVDMLASTNPEPLQLTLANGAVYPQVGRVIFTDRQVDPQTGTIRIVGGFANPGNVLRPGQFAKIRALTGNNANAVVVPQRAVTELQGAYQVAVVSADNKVSIRTVKVGDRTGSLWVISDGLKPGEHVIVEGLMKVRDGATVTPKLQAIDADPDTKAE